MAEENKNEVGLIAALLGVMLFCMVAGFFLGSAYVRARMPDITERTDTTTVFDTIPYYKPIPKDSIVYKYIAQILPVHDTALVRDSVLVDVPIERKTYAEDSTFYAVVSGFRPSLDTLLVYQKTVTIEKVRNITSYEAFRWSLGPFISQEVGLSHYAAKAGVQADLSLGGGGRWRFVPEAGYMWTSWDKGGWYAGGRLRYDLIRRR